MNINSLINFILNLTPEFIAKTKNFGIQILFKILALGLGLVPQRFINSNSIDIDERASYAILLSINAILFSFLDIGLTQLLYRVYTKESDEKKLARYWTSAFTLRVVCYFIGLVMLNVFTNYIYKLTSNSAFLIYGIYTIQYMLIMDSNFKSVSDTRNNSIKYTLTDLIGKIIIAVSLILLPLINPSFINFNIYIGVSLLAYFVVIGLDYYYQKQYIQWSKPNWSIITDHKSIFFMIVLTAFIRTLCAKIPVLFIEDKNKIISYDQAFRIYEIFMIVPSLIIPVVASEFTQKFNKMYHNEHKVNFYNKYLKLIFLLGVFCTALSFVGIMPLLWLTKSLNFENIVIYTFLINISYLVIPLLQFFGQTNFLFDNNKFSLLNIIALCVISIPLYYILYNQFQVFGLIATFTIINVIDLIIKFVHYKHIKKTF